MSSSPPFDWMPFYWAWRDAGPAAMVAYTEAWELMCEMASHATLFARTDGKIMDVLCRYREVLH